MSLKRIRRHCSLIEDFHIQANVLKNRFMDQGYNPKLLEEDILKIANIEREEFLKPKGKGKKI